MEEFGILSLIPPIVAIILALTTKDVIISLVSSVAAGALVLAHFNPHGAFVIFWKDLFFTELTVNSWNGELIILVTIIGGFVEILDRSGGARAFGTLAHKVVNNRLKAQLVTWFGGLLIFFSDSANSLILGPIFRPIYDKIKVSREKLSYILDSTSSPICVLIPITTWVAVIAGIIQTEFSRINIAEDSYAAYNQALPYLLYPILALLLVPLVAISGREFGSMARAEHRAVFENKPWSNASAKLNVSSNDNFDYSNAKASVAVVPLVVLFGMIIIMFVSFDFPAKELSSTETKMSLATAYFLGSMACVLMVAKNKIMTFVQAVGVVIEGMQKMTYMSIVLIAAFCLGNVCGSLGTAKFIVDITRGFLTPALLPFFMFVIGCIIAFATGTSHGTFGILLPLAIPISMQFEINVYIGIAAVVSGALFGDHCSPISDSQQNVIGVLTAVEHIHVVKVEIYDMDLRMVLPQIVPKLIDIVAPATVHQQQILPIEVRNLQLVFVRQPVVDGDCTAEAPPRQFQPGTAPQVQHGLIKNTAYNINVFAEIGKNFPCIFRRVLKGHDLEFNIGVQCLHSRPEIHQKLCGRHGGRADADDVFVLLHGVLRPRHRVAAILDDVSGVLIHGAPSFCQCQPPVAAVE